VDSDPAVAAVPDRGADDRGAAHRVTDQVEVEAILALDPLLAQVSELGVADRAGRAAVVHRVTAGDLRLRRLHNDVAAEVRDFAAISQVAAAPLLLVTHPSLPVKSVNQLVVLARSRPGQLNYASGGNGTGPHIAMELFAASTGVKMVHVPYKGNGPAVIDVVGGQCQLMFANLTGVLTAVQAGRLRALAVSSLKRSPLLPAVPTVAEAGIAGYEVVQWFGLVAPAGIMPEIIARLHAEIAKVLDMREFRDVLARDGAEPVKRSPEEFAAFIKSEIAKWADLIRKSGTQLE